MFLTCDSSEVLHIFACELWRSRLDFLSCYVAISSTMKASLKFMHMCTGDLFFSAIEEGLPSDSLNDF